MKTQTKAPPRPLADFSLLPLQLGQVVTTANLLTQATPAELLPSLKRHQMGDWGDLDPEDWKTNNHALKHGGRLLSVYYTIRGVKFWIITEWDRSVTTFLLPEDY